MQKRPLRELLCKAPAQPQPPAPLLCAPTPRGQPAHSSFWKFNTVKVQVYDQLPSRRWNQPFHPKHIHKLP